MEIQEQLAESLKQACNPPIQEKLKRCWLDIRWNETGDKPSWICGVFAPVDIASELESCYSYLNEVGESVGIRRMTILEADLDLLNSLRARAIRFGTLEAWKRYFEIKFILTDHDKKPWSH